MAARPLIFGWLFALIAAPAFALIDRVVERTFPASGPVILKVDTAYGAIQVKTSDEPEIKIAVRQSVDASTEAAADQLIARELELEMTANEAHAVVVRARSKKSMHWTWEKWPPITMTIEVTAPKSCELNLVTRNGAISVGNFERNVTALTAQGAIFIGETGGEVSASSAQGDVSVTACARRLKIDARAGNVVVGRAFGPTEISGSGGAVEMQAARGPLRLTAEGGDVKVGFTMPLSGESDIRADGGAATVSLPLDAAATLDVRGEKISARELMVSPKSGAVGAPKLQADINSGGPRIVVRASGSVRLLGVPGATSTR